jgi:plastocyanin
VRTLVAFTTIAATAGSLLLGGSHPHSTTLLDASADASVSIRAFQFVPDTLRVEVGTKVSWTNTDEIEHTITSGTPDARDGGFNGVVDKRGATYTRVLGKAGTYRYFCDRHRFMNGTVIVNP